MALTASERLTEAQDAYHALQTGQSVVEVRDATGESVRFTRAQLSSLRAYIAELKLEIAGTESVRRPMKLGF